MYPPSPGPIVSFQDCTSVVVGRVQAHVVKPITSFPYIAKSL
jgi:hypothetical protein